MWNFAHGRARAFGAIVAIFLRSRVRILLKLDECSPILSHFSNKYHTIYTITSKLEVVRILKKYYEKGLDLTKCWKRYNYFPEFTNFIFGDFAEKIRQRGYLLNREVLLIYAWKNFWRRNLSKAEVINDEQKTKELTEKIFRINHFEVQQISSLLEEIMTLFTFQGRLALKVASTILTVVFPDLYGIFDARVRKALKTKAEDVASCVEVIFEMRKIAKEQQKITGQPWTPRMVDMSLWTLNKYGTDS